MPVEKPRFLSQVHLKGIWQKLLIKSVMPVLFVSGFRDPSALLTASCKKAGMVFSYACKITYFVGRHSEEIL